MLRLLLLFLLFFVQALSAVHPPELSISDVRELLNEMFEAHVSQKMLTPVLAKRAIDLYLEGLDPTKTYFLRQEVEKWLSPSEEGLKQTATDLSKGDFSLFFQIHNEFLTAISRREKMEAALEEKAFPEAVSIKEFKDLEWVTSEEKLAERLLKIKFLQKEAAEQLEPEARDKALRRIKKRRLSYHEELATEDPNFRKHLIYSYILKAFASALDAHTTYFTPIEASQFMIQVQQRLFGIGVQLRDDLNGFTVVKTIDGGPASGENGLKANDRVIAIEGEPVVGLDIVDVVELIRGEEGTTVCLTVLRSADSGEEKHEIELTRREVVLKESRISSQIFPFGDGVVAQISLHAFYQDPLYSSAADLQEEIQKIKKEHPIKGIILDLRNNSGGVLPQAVTVTGLFITKGIVVSIKDNKGGIEHLRDIDGRTIYDGPLIILTSKASASAAEIVAQTLQDYGRAIIVGDEHTYGKGTFQTFTLDTSHNGKINPKGEVKVTRGLYYTVSGKSPQFVGVVPDIIVPGILASAEIGEQYAKYPLENDRIDENFSDDLSDIPEFQREQISWLYRFNLQQCLKTYTRFLPTLQKNSKIRLVNDSLYQEFLNDLSKEEFKVEKLDFYIKYDPQLKEALNIMQDLILLLR